MPNVRTTEIGYHLIITLKLLLRFLTTAIIIIVVELLFIYLERLSVTVLLNIIEGFAAPVVHTWMVAKTKGTY